MLFGLTYKCYKIFYVRKSVKSIILRGKSQLHLKSPSLKKIGKYKHGTFNQLVEVSRLKRNLSAIDARRPPFFLAMKAATKLLKYIFTDIYNFCGNNDCV